MESGTGRFFLKFYLKKKNFIYPCPERFSATVNRYAYWEFLQYSSVFFRKKKWQKTLNLETFLFTDKELDTSKHHKTQKMMYLLLKPSLKLSVQCTFYPVQVINCHLQLGFLSQLSIYFLFYILQYLNFLNSSYVKMLFRLNDHPFVLVKILNCSI